jgi:hypothetical protein
MKSAYNHDWVYNLAVIKEVKRWWKHDFITKDQFVAISEAFKIPLYHPNLMIRILLFIATLFALSGVSGFFFLIFADAGERALAIASIFYGLASFFALEKFFIENNHYKSGVTEALLYHACGFTIGGVAVLTGMDSQGLVLIISLGVLSFAAIRYLDLICTMCATLTLAGIAFYECFMASGIFKQIIPFVIIILFALIYWLVLNLRARKELKVWQYNLIVIESLSLLLIYLGGNYFVVRELSVSMMDLDIPENGDIPFAFIFYFLTAAMPIIYLFFAIRNKNVVLLRVSLAVIALSAFTFKYYFSLGHPEITLTVAGALLLIITLALMNYLKVSRGGFTRENLLSEKWGSMNVEAFVISQTMGGNQVTQTFKGGGGTFGGGGASGDF